jgi:hypothetical protein
LSLFSPAAAPVLNEKTMTIAEMIEKVLKVETCVMRVVMSSLSRAR